ncbi:hypothetical protein AZE42_03959 [Rhizopogon vesiculosus]|uniref:Uncharacterized protein n=1 Tax=Rhizopogon vesiculosus TaxID=180088 RepID=A0A1J8PSA5_9AGAM|nr:hypothetical protein AZE42_03959 [Rhizopogon vesiculosus]
MNLRSGSDCKFAL